MRPALVSVVIPAFNEASRLPACLDTVRAWLATQSFEVEVIVADDGSTDGTASIVREWARQWPALRLVSRLPNRGKGDAVRHGISISNGDVIAYSDCDLAAPIEQLGSLISDLEFAEVALVSRALPGATLKRRQSPLREFAGKMYAAVAQYLLLAGVPDAHCGLKAYRGTFGRAVFEAVGEAGILFDTEALVIATLRGGRISQRPAIWSHDPDTRLAFNVRGMIDVAAGLLRIKIRHRVLRRCHVRPPLTASSDGDHVTEPDGNPPRG